MNLPPGHAQSPEDSDLTAALSDADREGVEDQEESNQQSHQTREKEAVGKGFHQTLGLFSPAERGFDLVAGTQFLLNPRSAGVDTQTLLERHVDPVKRPSPAEHELGRVNVHDAQVTAESPGHSSGRHDAANGEGLGSEGSDQADRVVFRQIVPGGKIPGYDQAVWLGKEYQRIRDHFVIPLEPVVPHAPVACHIDAQNQNVPLSRIGGSHHRLDDGDGGLDAGDRTHHLQRRFRNSGLPRGYLQHSLARNLIDRVAQGRFERGIGRADGTENRYPEDDSEEGKEIAQQVPAHFRNTDLSHQKNHEFWPSPFPPALSVPRSILPGAKALEGSVRSSVRLAFAGCGRKKWRPWSRG